MSPVEDPLKIRAVDSGSLERVLTLRVCLRVEITKGIWGHIGLFWPCLENWGSFKRGLGLLLRGL